MLYYYILLQLYLKTFIYTTNNYYWACIYVIQTVIILITVDVIVLYRVPVLRKKERGKLLFVSFIKIETCLGLGQTTSIIIEIRIEACACSYMS